MKILWIKDASLVWHCDIFICFRVTGGELFEDIVAREYYSEADARYVYL